MDRKRPSLFYPKSVIPDKTTNGVPTSRASSQVSSDHGNEIKKMREAALNAEMRKYFQLEAKILFKQKIQDIIEQEGTSVEELMKPPDEPRGALEKLDFAIHVTGAAISALASLPAIIILLALQGLAILIPIVFIYMVIKGGAK